MDVDDARTIGARLRQVRNSRKKSLRVVAGLAGMSKSHLSEIERGERSPTLNELVALADALQISVPELTRLPVPAPANGHTDSTTKAIGLALDAIEVGHPGGLVLPVAVLRDRVARVHQYKRACRFPEVAADLPGAGPGSAHHAGYRRRPWRVARAGRLPACTRHPTVAPHRGRTR